MNSLQPRLQEGDALCVAMAASCCGGAVAGPRAGRAHGVSDIFGPKNLLGFQGNPFGESMVIRL